MSRRGGGRRPEYGRGQQSPSPSFDGRGRGRGSRGGRGRASTPASVPAQDPTPSFSAAPRESAYRPIRAVPSDVSSSTRGQSPVTAVSISARRQTPVAASTSDVPRRSPATAVSSSAQRQTPVAASTSASQLSAAVEKSLKLSEPSQKMNVPPASSKAVRFPARPGFGTIGQKCLVRANHFLVEVADRNLHHYDVTITPEVTSKKINRDVISELVKLYGESHLARRKPAYDGRKSLYTAGPLPFESKEFMVKLADKNGGAGSSSSIKKEREFRVAIKYASKADLYHLQQFLQGRQMDAPQETIQILDVVLRASPSNEYTVVGRSFFHPKLGEGGELGDGIEYWRGYYQSLRPAQMGLSFNIDVSARAFYEPILVSEFVSKYFNVRDLSRPLSEQDRVKVKRALKGVKVALTHGEYTKTYKVTGVSNRPINQTMFTLDDKKTEVSVAQYFRERYNIGLKYTSLPAIQAGSDAKPIYLPMELCQIVGGQRYTKKLNERQVTALLRATCQRPNVRESSIKKIVVENNFSNDKLVKDEFGIDVHKELTLIEARVLPPPLLKYHDSGRESRVDPRLGQWNMINKKMVNGGRVESWTCVNFSTRVNPGFPVEFCRQLIEMCNSKGLVCNPNPILPVHSARPNQIERALVDIHKQATAMLANQTGKQLQLLIIILPDVSGSYGKIKRICETELGIVSQCCQPKQASKLSKQYLENLSLKINVKVGGRNTVLNDAIQRRIPHVTDCPTIIFGADVTHPQPGEDSSPSIAAVVASMDWPEVTKYRGIVSAQAHREEIIQDLYTEYQDPEKGLVRGGMIRELFFAFRNATGLKPGRIIFYRDGVSEGQFSQVLLHEMDAIRKACNSLSEGYLPPVTFVVVQKRHHTRFFPADHHRRDQTDKSGNILPGTIVETMICHPTEFDFYLNSHAGIQGTSRPAHYHVLFDENNFSADELQTLTNNLCYTYARCTRSVSIVPPAYYAHLAAFRARYYIEGETSDAGSSSGGRTTTGGDVDFRSLPVIKDNVKNVMFYC